MVVTTGDCRCAGQLGSLLLLLLAATRHGAVPADFRCGQMEVSWIIGTRAGVYFFAVCQVRC